MTKRFLSVLLVFCLAGSFVFADNDVAASKTRSATAGLFAEDQDKYLDVIDYKDISKTMLFLSMGSPYESSSDFQFGFAKRFGEIFVGSRVTIDRIGKIGSNSITESSTVTLDRDAFGINGTTTVTNKLVNYADSYDNSVDALIGIGNMGFGIGVEHQSTSQTGSFAVNVPTFPTNADAWTGLTNVVGNPTTSTVTTYHDATGVMNYEDSLVYGDGIKNNTNLGVNLLFGMEMPVAGFDASFGGGLRLDLTNANQTAVETDYIRNPLTALYTTYQGVDNAVSYRKETADRGYEIMVLNPILGFEVEMPVSFLGGSTLTTGLGYDLNLPIYTGDGGSSYSYNYEAYTTALDGLNLETVVTRRTGEEVTEISEMTNSVLPFVEVEKVFSERLKLGFGYYPVIEMYSYSTTYTGSTTQTVVTDNIGTDTDSVVVTTVNRSSVTDETNSISFRNTIAVGTQFMLTQKLRINAGATASGGWLTSSTTKGSVSGVSEYHQYTYEEVTDVADATADGVLTGYDISEVTSDPDQRLSEDDLNMATSYSAGITYFYDENLKIDMLASLGGSSNIFDFATWTVEFTYSY